MDSWKEEDVERTEEGRDGRGETGVEEEGKTVFRASEEMAGTSRVFQTAGSGVRGNTREKSYYRRGRQKLKEHTAEMIPRLT